MGNWLIQDAIKQHDRDMNRLHRMMAKYRLVSFGWPWWAAKAVQNLAPLWLVDWCVDRCKDE